MNLVPADTLFEEIELDTFLKIGHLLIMLKAKAHLKIQNHM